MYMEMTVYFKGAGETPRRGCPVSHGQLSQYMCQRRAEQKQTILLPVIVHRTANGRCKQVNQSLTGNAYHSTVPCLSLSNHEIP
jgi:hypothetical protein